MANQFTKARCDLARATLKELFSVLPSRAQQAYKQHMDDLESFIDQTAELDETTPAGDEGDEEDSGLSQPQSPLSSAHEESAKGTAANKPQPTPAGRRVGK